MALKSYQRRVADYEEPPYGFTRFGAFYIHIRDMEREEGLPYHHLWSVLTGRREPSLAYSKQLAGLLGMTMTEFVTALESRETPHRINH